MILPLNAQKVREWYKPKALIFLCGSLPAIKHKITGELGVFGKAGEIWEWDDKILSVLVYGRFKKVLKEMSKLEETPTPRLSASDEHVFFIQKRHSHAVSEALKVPKRRGRQVTLANRLKIEIKAKNVAVTIPSVGGLTAEDKPSGLRAASRVN